MQRLVTGAIVIAALALVGWYGWRALAHKEGFPVAAIALAAPDDGLPDSPEEWRGRIDYRTFDRRLIALSLRPEMTGLAVAVVEQGKISFVRTYGSTDRTTREPVTPETVFRWASVSKTVAGTLAGKLASEDRLDLDRAVGSWPGSLRLPGGAEERLTLAQLMSHRTGLTKNAYDTKLEQDQSPGLLRASLGTAPLQCVPGTCHTYQNIAFDASSEILGQAAGTLYSDAATKEMFAPLGMTSVSFDREGLMNAKSWARPHASNGDLRPVWERYWRVPAAAGVNSDIVDLARWLIATMGERSAVLSEEALAIAQSPRVATHRVFGGELARALDNPQYGLGWRSFGYRGHRLIGHSGALDGYRATLIFDPAEKVGVVALWNSNWGYPFRIPFAALDSYYGPGEHDWLDMSGLEPHQPPALPVAEPAATR